MTDVVISWFGSVPNEVRAKFSRSTKFIDVPIPAGVDIAGKAYIRQYSAQFQMTAEQQARFGSPSWFIGGWPHPIRAILQKFGVTGAQRVAVTGFSEGCSGVSQILKSQDAGFVEQFFFCDGAHGIWNGGKPNATRDNIVGIEALLAEADMCGRGPTAIGGLPPGQHYMTITHSGVVPPTYPSTTDVALKVLNTLYGSGWPSQSVPDDVLNGKHNPPWTAKGIVYSEANGTHCSGQHGLFVLGYANLDPAGTADHIYQGKVVYSGILTHQLAERWNRVDPSAAVCATGVSAPSQCNATAPVALPKDYMTQQQDASLDMRKYGGAKVAASGGGSGVGTALAVAVGVFAGVGLGRLVFRR